ncbi:hypothetical protein DAMA08_007210 [Martiniozyma asiatica (nom. inval.)]|nr:hypothetical protein DAMA08_007210 [Martiniozyma asiatica]
MSHWFNNTSTSKTTVSSPYVYATQFIVPDKYAGRSVAVPSKNINKAISKLNTLIMTNNIKEVYFDQRFYTKPSKRRLANRVRLRKQVFQNGIKNLFKVVRNAVRRGY